MLVDTKHLSAIAPHLIPAFVYVLEHAGEQIPVKEMALRLQRTQRAVIRNLRELESDKYIVREAVYGQASRYNVRLERQECRNVS